MIEHLLRELTPKIVGGVSRRYGDFTAAEDAVQEALLAAAEHWSRAGIPDNPGGWLYQVASRRMVDAIRADAARRRREADVAPTSEVHDPHAQEHEDDTLTVLFMSCHPALTSASAVALTLRAVGGLTTAEIASAFLVPEATMAQRISRAKQTIRSSGVRFEMPPLEAQAERLGAVRQILYLIFNEGYTSTAGPSLHRVELSAEAIRLTRMLLAQMPDEPETCGLLALMLLTDARRPARMGASGELIPLDEQDRSLWDRRKIEDGVALITAALPQRRPGPYQVQAAIAAIHDEAARVEDTDWPQILAFYEVLLRLTDNPVVTLNHAVATAMVHGPEAGLGLLDRLDQDGRMKETHRLDAVRGHLHERAGQHGRARECFLKASARTASLPERQYLMMKAARLS